MLHLLESADQQRTTRPGWTITSTVVHAALIAAVAMAGTRTVAQRIVSDPPDTIIYTVAPEPAPRSMPRPAGPAAPTSYARPTLDVPQVTVPTFGSVIDRILPSRAWTPAGAPAVLPLAPASAGPPHGGIFSERSVDRAVVPLPGNHQPDYPAMLRSASVPGEVVIRFVVDTTGMVERGSIVIAHATHALFAEAVRRWLAATRYRPAEVNGSAVRQLVEQRIEFTLQ